MTELNVISTDEDNRPAELAPGTSATYNYTFSTGDATLASCLAWLQNQFAATASAELNQEQYTPNGDESPEYFLTITVPSTHHVAFREYLDDHGWEEERPDGWMTPENGFTLSNGDELRVQAAVNAIAMAGVNADDTHGVLEAISHELTKRLDKLEGRG